MATNGKFVTEEVLENPNWTSSNSDWKSFVESTNPPSAWSFPNWNNSVSSNVNPGFTQVRGSFETDVEQITPTDQHTNNNNNF